MKIMCIGQAAYDITIPMDHYPEENRKFRFKGKIECGGGSASNAAYLLAKWGLNSYFAGVVGNDYYGECLEKEFKDLSVNTKYLEKLENKKTTSSYIIANTTKGSRTILTEREDNIKLSLKNEEKDLDYIFLDGYEPDFAKKVIKDNPKAKVVIDAGSLKEGTVELCHLADYIVCSQDFLEEYTKMKVDFSNLKTLTDAYDKLKKDFKDQNLIVTLESKGSFTYDHGYKLIPSIKVEAKDSTAAGDIYHGAFTYFLAKEKPLIENLRLSNITGAISVTRVGGRYSIPKLEEVEKTYNDNPL